MGVKHEFVANADSGTCGQIENGDTIILEDIT